MLGALPDELDLRRTPVAALDLNAQPAFDFVLKPPNGPGVLCAAEHDRLWE
jgi:hypothetical protein